MKRKWLATAKLFPYFDVNIGTLLDLSILFYAERATSGSIGKIHGDIRLYVESTWLINMI